MRYLPCLIALITFTGLFSCDDKTDTESGNDTIEIMDVEKPDSLGALDEKVIQEARDLYVFILEKQRIFYCHACYGTPDTLVSYPNLYLKRYVTKSEKYLFIEYVKYFNAPEKRYEKLEYENQENNTGILSYDRISFLFDLQNEKWEYIGGKVATEDRIVQKGYDYLKEKTIHRVLAEKDTFWIKRYGVEGLKTEDIPQFVVEDRLSWMKVVKEQLSPGILVVEWW